jgi:Fe-S-cluster containining protein
VTTCLSFHAAYRCRHSGACCRAGWTIPFDAAEREAVAAVRPARGLLDTIRGGAVVARRGADGACSFLGAGTGLCAIHEAGGHLALPVSCRMFPRIVLHDSRGTFISLSHYCPTAAALLFDDDLSGPAVIVAAPPALADVGVLDGLDAREAWAPLLRPGVLTDLESYARWETRGIGLLTETGVAAAVCLDALAAATSRIERWSPGGAVSLIDAVDRAFAALHLRRDALAAHEPGLKRWLAARLFGNWIAYQGDGLQAIVRYLRGCLSVFTSELARDGNALEAVRRSDLAIVHRA